jgi:hypothetical protein
MVTIELFLPLHDQEGHHFPQDFYADVRALLAERFGGVTAFMRSPAIGIWRDDDGIAHRDEIVVFEVMAEQLDTAWWGAYRRQLERRFRQDEVLIRATETKRL